MSLVIERSDFWPQECADALRAFHDALLPDTIRNALETSFFRKHLAGVDPAGIDRDRLGELPTVEKDDIRAAGRAAQQRAGVICNDILTTGTTGNPLVTVRGDREQRFIRDFFAAQSNGQTDGPLLRGLEFANPYHGHLIEIPAPIHYHRVSVYDAGSFEYGRKVLLQSYDEANVDPRCSVLVGLERALRAFTVDTISQYPQGFPPTALRLVVSYSQYLTNAWRRRLEETWGARVIDRFGVSEIFGGASQCLACGWWHFEPVVIPEVVGAYTGKVLFEGTGLLALTALFPFQQAQPLIRYLTGDLVEVTHESSCRPGTVAIKPLGRAQYGVPEHGSDRWLLTPASILEAVDEMPEIRRIPRFADVEQVADPFAIGHPKYRMQWFGRLPSLEVKVELEVPDSVPSKRRTEIADYVFRKIVEGNQSLPAAVGSGTISITVELRDSLTPDLISQAHSGGVWSPT